MTGASVVIFRVASIIDSKRICCLTIYNAYFPSVVSFLSHLYPDLSCLSHELPLPLASLSVLIPPFSSFRNLDGTFTRFVIKICPALWEEKPLDRCRLLISHPRVVARHQHPAWSGTRCQNLSRYTSALPGAALCICLMAVNIFFFSFQS